MTLAPHSRKMGARDIHYPLTTQQEILASFSWHSLRHFSFPFLRACDIHECEISVNLAHQLLDCLSNEEIDFVSVHEISPFSLGDLDGSVNRQVIRPLV